MNQDLYIYTLRQADNSMVLAQRLCELCARAPELEEDIALGNIALDVLGEAKSLYEYAATLSSDNITADDLVFMRDERDWVNCLLVEQTNGDFAHVMARQFFYDAYHQTYLAELQHSVDQTLAAVASKSIKESNYHLRHSRNWILRLGDGTEQSHRRMQNAVEQLWRFVPELFFMDDVDQRMLQQGIGVDLNNIETSWNKIVREVLTEATLTIPGEPFPTKGGRQGIHGENFGYMLAEMQILPRSMPGCQW